MNMRKRCLFGAVAAGAIVTAAVAVVVLVEVSTKTKGATTITWDSAFEDLDYTLGDTLTFPVTWTVDAGAAEYSHFELKRVTPRSRRDPAVGVLPSVTKDKNAVIVEFVFTDLHLSEEDQVEIGNAHFKLYLLVDEDGDGTPELLAGYGVNLHVEDPL